MPPPVPGGGSFEIETCVVRLLPQHVQFADRGTVIGMPPHRNTEHAVVPAEQPPSDTTRIGSETLESRHVPSPAPGRSPIRGRGGQFIPWVDATAGER